MLKGALTALITPFSARGGIDETAFCNLIEWQISEGIHGLVPVGTTGEAPTLSYNEHKRLIEVCIKQVNKRVPVIAGAGANSTSEAVELALYAERVGADALLVVTPYYNKPSQRGLYTHFSAIAEAVSTPILIYNIPGRSVIDMLPDTMGQLKRDFKNIVGVKDATGRMDRVSEQRLACGKNFVQLSGEDSSALGFNAQGGMGCISVTSNIAPRLCSELQNACLRNDYYAAFSVHERLVPIHKVLFLEPNPAGIKYAASRLGLCTPLVRLPLLQIDFETAKMIDAALINAGLLDS
ncbi:MAG: 4-hydroxy-tetrahydrodipicolinate synthase [Candidatus Tokpelaia sp. JSC161]|jgi:4-hydroxy-tetrahydrodipicolinate synthase|nr:MAG: 4-hydroxy-tetrahydrodipicolinate synthase [Candidatus Tokpelaia sp. JSC161]